MATAYEAYRNQKKNTHTQIKRREKEKNDGEKKAKQNKNKNKQINTRIIKINLCIRDSCVRF